MPETGYIYTLNDPRTDEPKYVGATVNPRLRLSSHQYKATNSQVGRWLSELQDVGEKPYMTIIRVAPVDELSDVEQDAIEELNERWELLNKRSGGYPRYKESGKPGHMTEQDYHQIVAKPETQERFDRIKRFISYRDDYDYNDDETLREILDTAEAEFDV